jgi:hypothetical protein
MRPATSLALKEWAAVVHALGTGKQLVLLRKGGLHEPRGRFAVEPTEFFLFPTYVHQMEQGIVREALEDYDTATQTHPAGEEARISHYATVHNVYWLDSLDRVASLKDLHCWTPETIEKRFVYGTRHGLYLFVLRVYRLPRAYILPRLKRYGGCRSWVELEEELRTAGAVSVLSDTAFAEQVRTIRNRLVHPPAYQDDRTDFF